MKVIRIDRAIDSKKQEVKRLTVREGWHTKYYYLKTLSDHTFVIGEDGHYISDCSKSDVLAALKAYEMRELFEDKG